MSLRTRLTLAGGGAVFVALAVASLVIYFSVRAKLHDQIDISLIQTAEKIATKPPAGAGAQSGRKLPPGSYEKSSNPGFPRGALLGTDGSSYFQIIPSFAAAATMPNSFVPLIDKEDARVASGRLPPYFRDITYHGTAMRLYTMRLGSSGDGLVRTARALTEANATLGRVRWLLLGLTLGGAVAAAVLGRLAAAAVLRPVRNLAGAVREVTATRDLNRRIAVTGRDELGSLAEDFNAMLGALEESLRAQQQLIADASHELRTPLTAHRANVELLARPDLPPERRAHVLGAAVRGIEELSTLVSDLIQAARNGKSVDARTPVALDKLVATAIGRAQRRAPRVRFESQIEPHMLSGAPARIERALDNVLDNAIKWSPADGIVDVTVMGGLVSVRDHGPGIETGDLPHVLDRFYRAAAARRLPGSGLGLAIVKQTVDDHGGSVTVANAEGGGTLVALRFDPRPA